MYWSSYSNQEIQSKIDKLEKANAVAKELAKLENVLVIDSVRIESLDPKCTKFPVNSKRSAETRTSPI